MRTIGCSVAFSPPEFFSSPAIDPFQGDIWSLGILLYYIIAGYLPWSVHSRADLIEQIKAGIQYWDARIPYHVRRLIIQMTNKDPSADDIERQLGELLAAEAPIPLLSAHQSLSSDLLLKFNTGTMAVASADGILEKKDTVKAFGNIALACLGKRRSCGLAASKPKLQILPTTFTGKES